MFIKSVIKKSLGYFNNSFFNIGVGGQKVEICAAKE